MGLSVYCINILIGEQKLMVLTSWCAWVPWYSLCLLLLCRRVSFHSLWTVEQGVFFREAFYALMFVWAGGIVEVCSPTDSTHDPSTHLNFSDIAVDSHENTSTISVRIKASKTDPFRQGTTIYLGATPSYVPLKPFWHTLQ